MCESNLINEAKYCLLEIILEQEGNTQPNRKDVERIIGVGYGHAGHYLRAWRQEHE